MIVQVFTRFKELQVLLNCFNQRLKMYQSDRKASQRQYIYIIIKAINSYQDIYNYIHHITIDIMSHI